MRTLTDKSKVTMAERLLQVVEERRALEREEKTLKAFFKAEAKCHGGLKVGSVLITLIGKSRTGLDRGKVLEALGPVKFKGCETTTEYQQVDVRLDSKIETA